MFTIYLLMRFSWFNEFVSCFFQIHLQNLPPEGSSGNTAMKKETTESEILFLKDP